MRGCQQLWSKHPWRICLELPSWKSILRKQHLMFWMKAGKISNERQYDSMFVCWTAFLWMPKVWQMSATSTGWTVTRRQTRFHAPNNAKTVVGGKLNSTSLLLSTVSLCHFPSIRMQMYSVPLFHVFHCSMCCTVHCLCTIFMIDGHALIRPTFAMTCQNKTMSVWLQAFGEFFWAFVMNEANIFWEFSKYGRNRSPWREGRWFATCILNNECMLIEAKQMSSKERFLDLECDSLSWSRAKFCPGQVTFLRYDVKPFPVKYGRFSTWSIQSGLFAKACFWSSQSSWMFII